MNDYWKHSVIELFTYHVEQPLLFNSISFLFFFAVFISIYACIRNTYYVRTLFVILFSLFFYYKSSGIYLVLLCCSILYNYSIGHIIYHSHKQIIRKFLLVLSIVANLSLLGYYKYTNFFLGNYYQLKGESFDSLDIFLPIGISFFTFQALSYVVDIYRKEFEPNYNILDFAFYISFFPQLVAGPIVRAAHFLPQLKQKITISNAQISAGLFLIMQGLFKKALIADYISQYNDLIFASPSSYSGFENLIAVYGYTLQIYCDFSGYSDIAIGIGKMMGFDLGINFLKPYQAMNITDFWRRWHISLSTWLRDYLYIPLGGNRKGRTYVNLLVTMLLGGLWHGASWKFVVWGGMHGVGLAFHKLYMTYFKRKIPSTYIGRILSWLLTYHFVVFLWIFFRASDFETALNMIGRIVYAFDIQYVIPFWDMRAAFVVMLFVGFAIHTIPVKAFDKLTAYYVKLPFVVKAIGFMVLVQLIVQFKAEGVQPFIYFQF